MSSNHSSRSSQLPLCSSATSISTKQSGSYDCGLEAHHCPFCSSYSGGRPHLDFILFDTPTNFEHNYTDILFEGLSSTTSSRSPDASVKQHTQPSESLQEYLQGMPSEKRTKRTKTRLEEYVEEEQCFEKVAQGLMTSRLKKQVLHQEVLRVINNL